MKYYNYIKDLEQAEIGARNALIELLKETHVTYIDLLEYDDIYAYCYECDEYVQIHEIRFIDNELYLITREDEFGIHDFAEGLFPYLYKAVYDIISDKN